ncbi:MAG: hypothetical protein EXR80_02050 [Methylococcales bacterium]|nr:hypothetical protein [Methylococcales bacterium]
MNKLIFICSLLLSLSCLADAEKNQTLNQFTGEWEGAGKQVDGSHWSIRVNIRSNLYVIDYPSLTCGGVLTLIKTTDTSLVFKETLTYGIARCINHGEVVLNKIAEHKAGYHWFDKQNKIEAVGELTRRLP